MRLYDDKGRQVIKLENEVSIGANVPGGVAWTYLRLDGSSNIVADGLGLIHDNANSRSVAANGLQAIRGAGGTVSSPDLLIGGSGVGMFDGAFNTLDVTLGGSVLHYRMEDSIFRIYGSQPDVSLHFGPLQDACLFRDSNDTLAMRRSTNPQSFRLYNTYGGGAEYERMAIHWNANSVYFECENAGTGVQRDMRFDASEFRWYHGGAESMRSTSATLQLAGSNNPLSFGITAGIPDVYLRRHAANELAMQNATSAQSLYIYRTYSSAGANYERMQIGWLGTEFILRTQNAGTGVYRSLKFNVASYKFQVGGTDRWEITTSGFMNPSTNNVYDFGSSTLRPRVMYGQLMTLKSGSNAGDDTRVGGTLNTYHGDIGNAAVTETDLWSYTVAGSTLATDGQDIEFFGAGQYSASASGDKRIRVYYGGTLIFDTGTLGPGASAFYLKGRIMRDGASAQKCVVDIECSDATVALNTTYTLLAKDNTASQILKITGSGAATSDVILRMAKAIFHRE